jgi:hypothetical protein
MEAVDMASYFDGELSLVASSTNEATQSRGKMIVPESGFEPEESLQLEDLWGSVIVENIQGTACGVVEENARATSERCKGKRRSRNRVEQRKAANGISYQSTDTLATAAGKWSAQLCKSIQIKQWIFDVPQHLWHKRNISEFNELWKSTIRNQHGHESVIFSFRRT